MEGKLLKGGKSVLDITAEQETELRKKQADLQAQKEREQFVPHAHNIIYHCHYCANALTIARLGLKHLTSLLS